MEEPRSPLFKTPAPAAPTPWVAPIRGFPKHLVAIPMVCSQCKVEQFIPVPNKEEYLKCFVCDHTVPMPVPEFAHFVESERYRLRYRSVFAVALVLLGIGLTWVWIGFHDEIITKIVNRSDEYRGADPGEFKERVPWYEGGTIEVREDKSKPPRQYFHVEGGKLTVKIMPVRQRPDDFLYNEELKAYMRMGFLKGTQQENMIPNFDLLEEGEDGEQVNKETKKNVTAERKYPEDKENSEEKPPPGPERDWRKTNIARYRGFIADNWLRQARWNNRPGPGTPGSPETRFEPVTDFKDETLQDLYYALSYVPQKGLVPPSELRRRLKAQILTLLPDEEGEPKGLNRDAREAQLLDSDFANFENLWKRLQALGAAAGRPMLEKTYKELQVYYRNLMEQLMVLYRLPLLRNEHYLIREVRAVAVIPFRLCLTVGLFLAILAIAPAVHRWKHKRGHFSLIFASAAVPILCIGIAFEIRAAREVPVLRLQSGMKIRNDQTSRPIRRAGLEEAPMIGLEIVGAKTADGINHWVAGEPVPVNKPITIAELFALRRDFYEYGKGLPIALAAVLGLALIVHRRIRDFNLIWPLIALAVAVNLSLGSIEKFYGFGKPGAGEGTATASEGGGEPGPAPPADLETWGRRPNKEMRELVDEFHVNSAKAIGIAVILGALYAIWAEMWRRRYMF